MKKKMLKRLVALSLTTAMVLTGCGSTGAGTAESGASAEAVEESSSAVEELDANEIAAEASSAETTAGGVITMARELDSNNLDPVMTADNVDIWILNMMVEGLVTSSDDGKEIIPAVADTWDVSEDGLTYTFHIRDGIKFSDGNDVTVEDCIYSLTRAKEADGPWIGMLDMIDTMEDGGDGTLVIKLTETSPMFLSTVAMFSSSIIEKAYVDEVGEEGLAENIIGTGPFVLSEWVKGEKMVFTANPYYWEEGCPKVDEIDILVVEDANTRVMQLESGQIDMASEIPYSSVDELAAYDGIKMNLFESTDVKFAIINCQHEILSDKNVRKALALATDKDAINTAVYFGHGTKAETFLSPSAPHYNADLPESAVDIEAAKTLLADAGYPDGFEITIEVGSGDVTKLQTATMIQQEWAEIGVTVDIQQIDGATARQNWKDGEYDVFLSNMTSDMTDSSELSGLWCIEDQAHCWRSYWNDEDQAAAETLCIKANGEMDENDRLADYGEMQAIMYDSVPVIPYVYTPFAFAASEKVAGYAQTPLGIYNFKNLGFVE